MIPLAYLVRKDKAVPPVEAEGGYATVQDEMIVRSKLQVLDYWSPQSQSNLSGQPTESLENHRAYYPRELPKCWTHVKDAQ